MNPEKHPLPQHGGSYVRDKKTGALTRKAFTSHDEQPQPPQPSPAPAPADDAKAPADSKPNTK